MKKLTILTFILLAISGLYAQQGDKNCDFKKDKQSCNYKQKNDKQYNKHNENGFLNMFKELNLSAEQTTKRYQEIKKALYRGKNDVKEPAIGTVQKKLKELMYDRPDLFQLIEQINYNRLKDEQLIEVLKKYDE